MYNNVYPYSGGEMTVTNEASNSSLSPFKDLSSPKYNDTTLYETQNSVHKMFDKFN